MYFYTPGTKDKKESSAFAKVASFYIDKFPLAFGGKAIYTKENGASSEDNYVKID